MVVLASDSSSIASLAVVAGSVSMFGFVGVSPRRRDGSALGVAYLLAFIVILAGLIGVFVALIGAGLKCDETCGMAGATSWRDDPNSWQWAGQFWLALGGLVASIGALVFLGFPRRWLAPTAMIASMVLWASWFSLLASG